MAITTQAGYLAAPKQLIEWASANVGISGNFSDAVTAVSAGNTANGIVPTNDGVLYPKINSFGGLTGYVTRIEYRSVYSALQHGSVFDTLFKAGAYSFGANTTLASQPSYASRVPNTDYKGLEIWVHVIGAFTGAFSVAITYLNENGTSSTTPVTSFGSNMAAGVLFQVPLAAGDEGVSKIVSVVESGGGTAGTFNVQVMRRLGIYTLGTMNASALFDRPQDYLQTGMPIIYDTSCITGVNMSASSARGWYHTLEIAMG